MNVTDSEVVDAIMEHDGFERTNERIDADVILVDTCSVRENAGQRVRGRVQGFSVLKKKNPKLLVGVTGCVAGRFGDKFFNKKRM